MNVLNLLKPKETVKYIYASNTLRQGLEKMKAHGYTAIPVITRDDGKYVGTVSEGDFLYFIIDNKSEGMKGQERFCVSDILRSDFNPAVRIDVTMDELLKRSMQQNFIPVTDDYNTFIGIVTRRDIIKYFIDKSK